MTDRTEDREPDARNAPVPDEQRELHVSKEGARAAEEAGMERLPPEPAEETDVMGTHPATGEQRPD